MLHPSVKKDAQLTIRLPSETKRGLVASADRRKRTTNWLVVHLIQQFLARESRRK